MTVARRWVVGRTDCRGAGAGFCGVTEAGRGAAGGVGRCELAGRAAVFVRVVAYGVAFEAAGRRVAARIGATAGCAATVTFFPFLDNAVAAGLAVDGDDALVG